MESLCSGATLMNAGSNMSYKCMSIASSSMCKHTPQIAPRVHVVQIQLMLQSFYSCCFRTSEHPLLSLDPADIHQMLQHGWEVGALQKRLGAFAENNGWEGLGIHYKATTLHHMECYSKG